MQHDDYQLLDSGNFQKLEQVGPYRIVRPSPQAVWRPRLGKDQWEQVDAKYERFSGGDGTWHRHNQRLPQEWQMNYGGLRFLIRLTDFGHLGLFAEQVNNWQRLRELSQNGLKQRDEFQVLNLFAYTGASSLAAAQGGAHVVHLDASKTSVSWGREQAELNGLQDKPIRWIIDDAMKFVSREVRRNRKYHGIILDPPSFGRGNRGEVWKIEEHLCDLLDQLKLILADDFSYVMLSSHSNGYTPLAMRNLLSDILPEVSGQYLLEEMVVPEKDSGRTLPSGACCLFVRD
ncbi:MAG: class I SAM-dependent methyltransferase [Oligoflexus sp.]